MRQMAANHLVRVGVEKDLMRHNAPTGVAARVDEFDLACVGQGLQGSLNSSPGSANSFHDRGHGRLRADDAMTTITAA